MDGPAVSNTMAGDSPIPTKIVLMQTRKGCFQVFCCLSPIPSFSCIFMQTCLGCDANEEFKIAPFADMNGVFLYIREETSFYVRFFLGSLRPFEMKMFNGMDQSSTSGPMVTSFHRYCKMPLHHCKCCCYQKLEIFEKGTQSIGSVQENCWVCVPSFNVYKPDGEAEYLLSPPTCCDGMCIDIFAEGLCNCRIPMYVFRPNTASTSKEGKV